MKLSTERSYGMVAAACVLALSSGGVGQVSAQTVLYDLSQFGAPLGSANIDGAYLFSITPTTSSGTGVFNSIVGVGGPSNGGSEQGYNATARPVMTDVDTSAQRTLDITRSSLASVLVGGISYYSFGLDINEDAGNGKQFISLDQLQVWVKSTPLTTAATLLALTGSGATKVWDMDAINDSVVLMNYKISGSGSGQADMAFLIPTALIDNAIGSTGNIYLYSQMGAIGTIFGHSYQSDGGFEEWSQVSGLAFTPPPPVPEAGTVAAIGAMAGLIGFGAWKSRRSALVK